MPLKRSQKAQKSIEQEGRILLGSKAMQNGRLTSVAAAAQPFDVPRATLGARICWYHQLGTCVHNQGDSMCA